MIRFSIAHFPIHRRFIKHQQTVEIINTGIGIVSRFTHLLRSATVKKFMAGYELFANPQRDITPEVVASLVKRTNVITHTINRYDGGSKKHES